MHICTAELTSALKRRLLAASYIYNPSKSPFDKGDLLLFCEQPAEGRRVDRVNRVDGIASLDGRDGDADA